jgi:hypothetical protein
MPVDCQAHIVKLILLDTYNAISPLTHTHTSLLILVYITNLPCLLQVRVRP